MAAKESMNVEGVKAKMGELEVLFTEFADKLKDINDYVNLNVNNGSDSAIFGEVGTKLLNIWNDNAATFGDFHANFESWAKMVSLITVNNLEFADEVLKIYKSNGSNLAGVSDNRLEKVNTSPVVIQENNSKHGKTYEYYDGNGNRVREYKDADGNLFIVHISDKNGTLISSTFYDAKGNIEKEVTYDDEGKVSEEHVYTTSETENGSVPETENPTTSGSGTGSSSRYGVSSEKPSNGRYDGHTVVVPSLSEQDFINSANKNVLRNSNAQVIVDSANAVCKNLSSEEDEIAGLIDILYDSNSVTSTKFNALTPQQQSSLQSYLGTQMNTRRQLVKRIEDDCYAGWLLPDGSVGDATTTWFGGNNKNSKTNGHYENYMIAANTANSWNESFNSLSSIDEIVTYVSKTYNINLK